MPLTFSTLPYNIDGFPLARIAADMSSSGSWRIDEADVNSYNEKMPAFSLVWSAVVQLGGLHVLADLQWTLPIVTSTTVLAGYLLGMRTTGHRGVGLVAGLFLAVFGSFLFLTSAIMKEALGLVVLPAVVLLFHGRADARHRVLAVALLLVLPFLHHLTALMALGMVSASLVVTHERARERGRFSIRAFALDVLTGPATSGVALAYYTAVNLPFLEEITSADDLVLVAALSMAFAFLLARVARPAARTGRRVVTPIGPVLVIPAVTFGGLLLNERTKVFAGTLGTQPPFVSSVLPAIAVLAAFVIVGYQAVRRTANRANDLVVAILAAPAAVITFGFLRGLDPLSFALVYRSFDYLDFALAILAGVGVAVAWARVRRQVSRIGLAVLLVASLLATTPLAWDTQAVLGVENVTTPEEFQALALLAALGGPNVTTDQRLASVAEWWFGMPADSTLPLRLRDGGAPSDADYAIVLERWTTVGAQVHPAPNVVLPPETLESFLERHRVTYAAGDPGDRVFVVRLVASTIS